MASVAVTLKLDPQVKARMDRQIGAGKYRHVSDFIHRAIAAELERAERGGEAFARDQMIHALRSDPEVRAVLFEMLKAARAESG
jgi:Arc/MetJ-type ribon-helix-helix transcriptional regulator